MADIKGNEVSDVDIVLGISIVRDEAATVFIASELDLGGVNGAERSDDGLAVNLEDSLVGVHGGGRDLGVDPVGDLNVAARDVQLHAVAGFANIGLVGSLTSEEVDEGKGSFLMVKKSLALLVHVGCESELLAVEDEGLAVLSDVLLGVDALLLGATDVLDGGEHTLTESGLVLVDVVRVGADLLVLVLDLVSEGVDVSPDVGGAGLQGLEGDEELSLDLDSFLVVVLVPNLLSLVEVVDVLVEISTWKGLSGLGMLVIRRLVTGVFEVLRATSVLVESNLLVLGCALA